MINFKDDLHSLCEILVGFSTDKEHDVIMFGGAAMFIHQLVDQYHDFDTWANVDLGHTHQITGLPLNDRMSVDLTNSPTLFGNFDMDILYKNSELYTVITKNDIAFNIRYMKTETLIISKIICAAAEGYDGKHTEHIKILFDQINLDDMATICDQLSIFSDAPLAEIFDHMAVLETLGNDANFSPDKTEAIIDKLSHVSPDDALYLIQSLGEMIPSLKQKLLRYIDPQMEEEISSYKECSSWIDSYESSRNKLRRRNNSFSNDVKI